MNELAEQLLAKYPEYKSLIEAAARYDTDYILGTYPQGSSIIHLPKELCDGIYDLLLGKYRNHYIFESTTEKLCYHYALMGYLGKYCPLKEG